MIPRTIIWALVAVGAFPVLMLSFVVAWMVTLSPFSRANGVPWYYRFSDALITSGNRLSIAGHSIIVYPRLWTTVLGVVGLLFVFICIYYTLHVPYRGGK